MRQADVKVGRTYAAKVSERIVPVTIVRDRYANHGWLGRNEFTGREVRIRGAQRLRFEVVKAEGCNHWVRTDRDPAAHRAQYHAGR